MRRVPDDRARAVGGGAVAGVVGGIVQAVAMALYNLSQGINLWVGFKVPAIAFFPDDRILQPGYQAGPVFLGIVTHFAVSALWGIAFGLLFYGLSRAATALVGLSWGLVVWLGMFYVVLPLIGASQLAQSTPAWWAIAQHLIYGLATALAFLPFQRNLPRRLHEQTEPRIPVTP